VVEDEADAVEALQSFFGRRGYDVATTTNGSQALDMVAGEGFDLVLLDITLEGMSGLDVLRALRAQGSRLRVILMTGQLLSCDDEAEVMSLGVSAYLQKPVVLARLDEAVVHALGSKGAVMAASSVETRVPEVPAGLPYHKMANILGIMRTKCENYVLDNEDGVNRHVGLRERHTLALGIMKDIMGRVDQLAAEIDILRRRKDR